MKSAVSTVPTTADAQEYWSHHIMTREMLDLYLGTRAAPYRDWAIEGIAQFDRHDVVLEAGCHIGVLLDRIQALKGVRVAYGIDANEAAVVAAQARGLTATVGTIPDCLGRFTDASVDVIVSSYCLSYIDPLDLPFTLAELLRIARQGIVIVEPMAGGDVEEEGGRDGSYVEWRHDYLAGFDDAVDQSRPQLRPPWTVEMTRFAKGPYAGINGMVVAKKIYAQ